MSVVRSISRFASDESGQGIIFAAASILVLVMFVAMVSNLGQVVERRTKMQMGADAAAFSSAAVEANNLSAIGWINSAMAQVYGRALQYAVDCAATAVAAKLELQMNVNPADGSLWKSDRTAAADLTAVRAHRAAWTRAHQSMVEAKQWMQELMQIESTIAIVTPDLVSQEMMAVTGNAVSGNASLGVQRVAFYPTFRLYPHESRGPLMVDIARGDHQWTITNRRGAPFNEITVRLDPSDGTWHIVYDIDGNQQEVVISQTSTNPPTWTISYYQPLGSLVQVIQIIKTGPLGWVVGGSNPGNGGGTIPAMRIDPVDMDGDGFNEGTKISQGDMFVVFMKGADGKKYYWSPAAGRYMDYTQTSRTVGGVEIQVDVSNRIDFPAGSATIGDPVTVDIGKAHIVLTDPPNISCSIYPVDINIHGFGENDFSIGVGGHNLNVTGGESDGAWDKSYNRMSHTNSRHRLVVTGRDTLGKPNLWRYEFEPLGALMVHENQPGGNLTRYAMVQALLGGNPAATPPAWAYDEQRNPTGWFDPDPRKARPTDASMSFTHDIAGYGPPDARTGLCAPLASPPPDAYYLTRKCTLCDGTGRVELTVGQPLVLCPACQARDHDGDGKSDVRIFFNQVRRPNQDGHNVWIGNGPSLPAGDNNLGRIDLDDNYFSAKIHQPGYTAGGVAMEAVALPLILTGNFFRYGINVGAWQDKFKPMLFPDRKQPSWGVTAISCARVGFPVGSIPALLSEWPYIHNGYVYGFSNDGDRADWCGNSPQNLYSGDVDFRLFPVKYQVNLSDLRHEDLPVTVAESPTSYLWDAVIASNTWYDAGQVKIGFDYPADGNTRATIRRMPFNYRDGGIDDVIRH